MQTDESHDESIIWASAALWTLGCPGLRPCEKDKSLVSLLVTETFRRTPDMVAGPIEGKASPNDFFIDVANLQGATLYNPKRPGGESPPPIFADPARNPGTFSLKDLPTNHLDGYLSTIEKKLKSYSTERAGSPLVGLCVHLDASQVTTGASLSKNDFMRFLTRFDYLRFLDRFFGISDMEAKTGVDLHVCLDALVGDKPRAVSFLWIPFSRMRFTFLCHTVKMHEAGDVRTLLIVNNPLLDEAGPFHDHAVLVWLRSLREMATASGAS